MYVNRNKKNIINITATSENSNKKKTVTLTVHLGGAEKEDPHLRPLLQVVQLEARFPAAPEAPPGRHLCAAHLRLRDLQEGLLPAEPPTAAPEAARTRKGSGHGVRDGHAQCEARSGGGGQFGGGEGGSGE